MNNQKPIGKYTILNKSTYQVMNRAEKVLFLNAFTAGVRMANAFTSTGRRMPDPPKETNFEQLSNEQLDTLIAQYNEAKILK